MTMHFLLKFSFAFLAFTPCLQAGVLGESLSVGSSSGVQAKASVSAQSSASATVTSKYSSLGSAYTIRETDDGVRVIKEYVDNNGVVFAISWNGVGQPDFSEIFGQYYADFKATVKSRIGPRQRKLASVQTDDMVFSNFGTGSVMKGIAYIVKLMPAGLAPEDL